MINRFALELARVHDRLLEMNKIYRIPKFDKWLHFVGMLVLTALLFGVIHAVIRFLARKSITAVSVLYTLTLIAGLGFAIETVQGITHTGNMEYADVGAGMLGAVAFFILRVVFHWIFGRKKRK